MSVGNFMFEELQALKLNRKVATSTYTVKTGRVEDGFVVNNPVDIVSPAANFTLTVPDGSVIGQLLLIVCTDANSLTCTATFTHHANGDAASASFDAADEYSLQMWTGTEWVTVSYSTTADVA